VTVGSLLAEARSASGLDLDEVAARTRVRAQLLRDMENDDFSKIGGAVYARGHLRAYAGALGLDPAPLLAEYDREHGHDDVPVLSPVQKPDHVEKVALHEPHRLSWTTVGVVTAGIAVVVAVSLYFIGGNDTKTPEAAAPPAASTHPSSLPSTHVNAPTAGVPVVPHSGVDVVVRAVSGSSWVGLLPGYNQQATLLKGQQKEFRDARQVDLRIGNPGAVEIIVNGKVVGIANSATPVDKSFKAADTPATTTN
jgi:cytoskeletal protein RodZ